MIFDFLSKSNNKSKNYLGLLLREEDGVAMIMTVKDGHLQIVEKERFNYSNGWENLVEDLDEVLFSLENKTETQATETIFFVYSFLIEEKSHEIKKAYLSKIKNLLKNLELKPLGFIECFEAVSKYKEKKEDLQVTAVLVEFDRTNLGVFIYKVGQLFFSSIISRTDSLIDDLSLALNQAKEKSTLPARIILYNSKDLDDEASKIISHRWSQDIFIQLPKVEIVKEEEVIESLAAIFEEQILSQTKEPVSFEMKEKEVMGFMINEDIKNNSPQEREAVVKKPLKFSLPNFTPFSDWLKNLRLPTNFLRNKITPVIGLVIIFLSLFINEFFFHKASLTVFVPTTPIAKKISLSLSEDEKLDYKVATQTANFSESITTTGKKEVGNPARGEVTIYNLNKEKTFDKGTVIEASGLKFSFNDSVKVASASTTSDMTRMAGKAKVKVTALQIGPESNFDKGTTFKIEDLDPYDYVAKNEIAFSEGTKNNVQTVSKKDHEDLKTAVLAKSGNLEQKNNNPSLLPNEKIINDLTEKALTDLNYSKEVGEEATSVTLTAKAQTTFYIYNKNNLLNFISSEISPDVPGNYILEKKNISYQIDKASIKSSKISIQVSVNAKATKNIDKTKIVNSVLGKDKKDLDQLLKKEYAINGFNFNLKQPLFLPFIKDRLPLIKKNITVTIDTM